MQRVTHNSGLIVTPRGHFYRNANNGNVYLGAVDRARACHYTFPFAFARGGCMRNGYACDKKLRTTHILLLVGYAKEYVSATHIYLLYALVFLYQGRFRYARAKHGIASLIAIPRANTQGCVGRQWFAVCELGAIKRKITPANITRFTNRRLPQLIPLGAMHH